MQAEEENRIIMPLSATENEIFGKKLNSITLRYMTSCLISIYVSSLLIISFFSSFWDELYDKLYSIFPYYINIRYQDYIKYDGYSNVIYFSSLFFSSIFSFFYIYYVINNFLNYVVRDKEYIGFNKESFFWINTCIRFFILLALLFRCLEFSFFRY